MRALQDGVYRQMNLPKGRRYGLIAEEVEEVLPELVKTSEFDPNIAQAKDSRVNQSGEAAQKITFKAVNYTELIPVLIKAVQEEQGENQALKTQLANQQQQINELTQMVLQ